MKPMTFSTVRDSHQHSLQTLDHLYQYDDFMMSISTMADLGCGQGADLEWWATRTTRDDDPRPLEIRCTGIDVVESVPVADLYNNVTYLRHDFEQSFPPLKRTFDVLWCHDSFQYVIDPFATLKHWLEITSQDGMLALVVPQCTNLEYRTQAFDQRDYVYHNWTMVSLLHVLAVSGWDCSSGFFRKQPDDPWLHSVVYKGEFEPLDPRTTRWYHLAEQGRLPASAVQSIEKHGYLRQRDLVLPWLDKSVTWMGQH